MITQAPLPDWLDLCRALFGKSAADLELAAPWRREGDVAGWLSRSTWSLALVAIWRQRFVSTTQLTVWIPDFFCNSSLKALRATGARLLFYPLTSDMFPDMDECRRRVSLGPPDLFVLVHYFGQPAHSPYVREFCRTHGAWLIEDAAHVLRPLEGVGQFGDFVMYSPHKHLALPDGAVLVVRPHGVSELGEAALELMGLPILWVHQLHGLRRAMGITAKSARTQSIIWLLKRVLQKIGARNWRIAVLPFTESSDGDTAALVAPGQSRLSKRLLSGRMTDLGRVARQRQRHQLLWDAVVCGGTYFEKDALSPAERSAGRNWTPYLCGYLADASAAPKVFKDLQRRGLPVTTWPDLPPEVMESKCNHANAWSLRHTRLYLPVHQSLSIEEIVKHSSQWIPDLETRLLVSWDEVKASDWEKILKQTSPSNLLQNWSFGQAKSQVSGWRCRHVIFYLGQTPVALVQVLQKRVLGLLLVSRINRGPLFLGFSNKMIERYTWEELGRLGRVWRGRVLTVAPELELTGPNLMMMEKLGFLQFSPHAWESARIDLQIDLPILRQKMNGKWRNALNSAEKAGLALHVSSSDQSVDWIMERYKEVMSEKGFIGPPVDLLRALRAHLPYKQHFIVLRAMDGEDPVAGICLVRHGRDATYLLGWNGIRGRKLKANQYLLWQAIIYLKQAGLDCFDLGGLDDDRTPGIAAFKLGMNGLRYELLGEYWRW